MSTYMVQGPRPSPPACEKSFSTSWAEELYCSFQYPQSQPATPGKSPFSCLHFTQGFFFHYSQHFINKSWWKILRRVGYDLALPTISDTYRSSGSHGVVSKLWWDCKFGTYQIDWFRSDRRRFILKRMKSVISCRISVSLASCKHTVCSDIVLCSFQHIFRNICLNLPLADLCFRCGLLFWQVRARAETGRAERATCTTQYVFA